MISLVNYDSIYLVGPSDVFPSETLSVSQFLTVCNGREEHTLASEGVTGQAIDRSSLEILVHKT
jgi:hypothetical protein